MAQNIGSYFLEFFFLHCLLYLFLFRRNFRAALNQAVQERSKFSTWHPPAMRTQKCQARLHIRTGSAAAGFQGWAPVVAEIMTPF
jgi:hypothetical protein